MRRARVAAIGLLMAAGLGLSAQAPPVFEVDPYWPRPLPNHWLFGSITGVAVDAQNHVWVIHRGAASLNARTEIGASTDPPTAEHCCIPAPQVMRFDPAGKVVAHWGGPGEGYNWPQNTAGISVDAAGNVWISAAGPPPAPAGRGRGNQQAATPPPPPPAADAHVLKFSRDGKFLLQIGKPGQVGDDNSTTALNRPMAVDVDTAANEVYVADGLDNHRIVVFNATTGAYKRHWGANGGTPFNVPSSVKLSKDGHVYVADRRNNRIQVFKKDGTFVKQGEVGKGTRGEGAVWALAFSHDPQQRYVFVADGSNQKVWVLRRDTLAEVTSFGTGGRIPGRFFGVSSVAVDASGNVYTGETYEGKRLQKFVLKGAR